MLFVCLFLVKVTISENRKPEEESSFWKITAERSRLEGEQADFQSLTPSQIKSIEKGEKPLPSYLRQVSPKAVPSTTVELIPDHRLHVLLQQETSSVISKDPEPAEPQPQAVSRPTKQRAPRPPAPQPPAPSAVTAPPAAISISNPVPPPGSVPSSSAGWERSQSTLPSVSNTLDEMFSSSLLSKPPSSLQSSVEKEEEPAPNPGGSPTFAQVSPQTHSRVF